MNWNFQPRTVVVLGNNKYLVGGLWGGLYILDLRSNTIKCLDDLKDDPVTKKIF